MTINPTTTTTDHHRPIPHSDQITEWRERATHDLIIAIDDYLRVGTVKDVLNILAEKL